MRVEMRGVQKRFGALEALRGIDLDLASGSRVALVGPNGSGKSTFLRALMGLVAVEGEVLLDGLSPFRDRVQVASRLAYVPQIAPQIAAPVRELVWTFARTRGTTEWKAIEIARTFGLDPEAIANRPFRDLSGGMKQKLLLSLALAAPADLLILDEPTASLDAAARDRFAALVKRLPTSTTVLLCSHRVEEVREHATSVVELAEGRVVSHAPLAPAQREACHA